MEDGVPCVNIRGHLHPVSILHSRDALGYQRRERGQVARPIHYGDILVSQDPERPLRKCGKSAANLIDGACLLRGRP